MNAAGALQVDAPPEQRLALRKAEAEAWQSGFNFCLAVESDSVDIFSLFTGVPQDLTGARRIRMFEVLSNPARIQYISTGRKLDNLTVQTEYG